MKVLITGGAGYLGSVLARHLLKCGHQVRVLDSLMYDGAPLLSLYPEDGFEFIHGDVRDTDVIASALGGTDAVVHLAAIVGDPACARNPDLARAVNYDSSIQLFEQCIQRGIEKFVFASTCSNYGKMANSSRYATETSELRPVSLYAESKVAVEKKLLAEPIDGGPTVTVLRFATLFGLSPRMRFDLTVNEFTSELLTKRKLMVYGQQFWRPYIHVRDAARAIALVLESSQESVCGQVFNAGDTMQNYNKEGLVELISDEIDGDVQIEYVHKDEDPRDYRVSFDRINRQLGFQITRTVTDGVREVIEAIERRVITDFDNACYRN